MVPGFEATLTVETSDMNLTYKTANRMNKRISNAGIPALCIFAFLGIGVSACAPRHEPGNRPASNKSNHATGPDVKTAPRVRFSECTTGLPDAGMWKCDPVFTDVNGDGALDVAAVARKGNGPHVWLGDGHGAWTDSSSGLNLGVSSCGGGLSIADVNGDGYLDLVQADHCHGVFVYLGDGRGRWNAVTRGLHPSELAKPGEDVMPYIGTEDVDVADVNGDGLADLVMVASDDGGINVFFGDGSGANWKRMSPGLPTKGPANRVMLMDVDGDGVLDLISSYSQGPRVWRGDGKGGWTDASKGLPEPVVYGLYRGLAIGDVNEDGRLDLVTANWIDGPEVYFRQEDGSWLKSPEVFPELLGGAIGLTLGDVDRDGHLDLVVSGRLTQDVGFVYGVYLLLGDGRGNWTWSRDNGLPTTGLAFTWGVALGDVDANGVLDIAAGSGGIVGTAPGPTEPSIPTRMLLWCATLPAKP